MANGANPVNGPGTQTHVPVVIPVTADTATSPPKTPWQAGLARLLAGAAILAATALTYIADPLVTYLSGQAITLPPEWKQYQPVVAIAAGGLVASYQSLRKKQKEAERLQAAREMGLADAIGRPTLRARNAARVATGAGGP